MSDDSKLGLAQEKHVLVLHLGFLLLLLLEFLSDVFPCLLLGLFEGFSPLAGLPLLHQDGASLLHVVALDDFILPESPNDILLIAWGLSEIGWDLLQMEVTLSLITIGHELGGLLGLRVGHSVQLEVGDGSVGLWHHNTWLVRLVIEVPNVNAIGLGDEDDTWSGGGELSTGVMASEGVGRAEDWLLSVGQFCVPDGEVEVVHRHEQLREER